MPPTDSTNTKGKRRGRPITAVSAFVALGLGLLYAIEVDELNLSSYMQNDPANQQDGVREQHGSASVDLEFAPKGRIRPRNVRNTRAKKGDHEQHSNHPNASPVHVELAPNAIPPREDRNMNSTEIRAIKRKVNRATKLLSQRPPSQQYPSPACRPHFALASSGASRTRSRATPFRRLYFYHARKAGGTSLANYLSSVARHHGLEYAQDEWAEAEEPGTHAAPTLYVAHLREPVDRSISHFKYQGRWACRGQLLDMRSGKFVPTEENAHKLETWNATGGHAPTTCDERGRGFRLGECAVNCYTQWFSGLSCPQYNVSATEQYRVAKAKLLRYNMLIILERLRDPDYVAAVERFFGVPGVTIRRGAACGRPSRQANAEVPLAIDPTTKHRLSALNAVDTGLYEELTDCLEAEGDDRYGFPGFEPARFANVSVKVPYQKGIKTEQRRKAREANNNQTNKRLPREGDTRTRA